MVAPLYGKMNPPFKEIGLIHLGNTMFRPLFPPRWLVLVNSHICFFQARTSRLTDAPTPTYLFFMNLVC